VKIGDVPKILGVYETHAIASKRVEAARPAAKKDKVSISSDAKDFQSVMRGLKAAPDIRAGKVAEHSAKYESGDSSADSRAVAEKLLAAGIARRLN
jgi:negative regulator of flagellin synthesis FlgM